MITNRMDRMDFATLTRDFAIQFMLIDRQEVKAEIGLEASITVLAGEILELTEENLGCTLYLRFNKLVQNVNNQCKQIEQALIAIWEDDIELTQTLSFVYERGTSNYLNRIELKFKPSINEEHMGDIPDFLYHVLETLKVLTRI